MAARVSSVADTERLQKAPTSLPEARWNEGEPGKDDESHAINMVAGGLHSANEPTPTPKTQTGLKSEHGHALSYVRPMTQHPGLAVSTFFTGLFTTIIGISTLGASITFSYVLSNNVSSPTSEQPFFDAAQIQQFLAISWLLFLLALANASLGSTVLTFFKDHWIEDWDGKNGKTSQFEVQMYAVFAAGLLGALVIGAFVLLCLVVVAYSFVVGWVALGFTAFFGLVIAVGVMHQFPWPWRLNQPRPASGQIEGQGQDCVHSHAT